MIDLILRDLKRYFRNPLIYFVFGLFCMMTGWIFFNLLVGFTEHYQHLDVSMRHTLDFVNEVILKVFSNINFLLLFIVPILTMKSISEEMHARTLDIFNNYLSNTKFVIGKFLSSYLVIALMIGTTIQFPFILGNLNLAETTFIFTGYLGLFFNAAVFVAIGIFASTISKQQMICALVSFVLIFFIWMFAWFSQLTSNYLLNEIIEYLSINHHFEFLVKGMISLSDIAFYFSMVTIPLIMAIKKLNFRKWGNQ